MPTGIVSCRCFGLLHLCDHQTHHRGQVTTLLTQAGEDVGGTDLLEWIPVAMPEADARLPQSRLDP